MSRAATTVDGGNVFTNDTPYETAIKPEYIYEEHRIPGGVEVTATSLYDDDFCEEFFIPTGTDPRHHVPKVLRSTRLDEYEEVKDSLLQLGGIFPKLGRAYSYDPEGFTLSIDTLVQAKGLTVRDIRTARQATASAKVGLGTSARRVLDIFTGELIKCAN